MNKKNGMVLGEVILALIVCGILMGVSIYMFKANDISVTPYIYSVMKNLPDVNTAVMEQCHNEGTCITSTSLPGSTKEYCLRLSDIFTTAGAVDCKDDEAGNDDVTITIDGTTFKQNFRLTNGVAFYNLNPGEWNDELANNYIDAFIDVNGPNRGSGTLGRDVFPIRIFQNGEVIPGVADDFRGYEDEEFFAYRVILDRALDNANVDSRVQDVIDAKEGINTNGIDADDLPFLEKVSFQTAVCISNPDNINNYYTNEDNVDCADFNQVDMCDFDNENNPYGTRGDDFDPTAFCTVEPVRPRGSGVFKMFGI